MRGFWQTLSFCFAVVVVGSALLRLTGLLVPGPGGSARLAVKLFAACAAVCGAAVAMGKTRFPNWIRAVLAAGLGVLLGCWALGGLNPGAQEGVLLSSCILTGFGIAAAAALGKLVAAAQAQEINEALAARRQERKERDGENH